MTETPKINWIGKSGKKYQYLIYPLPPNFKAVAGNYIFTKQNGSGNWVAVYVGQTEDLSERFDDHHKMPCIKRNSATHIHAHTNSNKNDRLDEESDLIENYSPPCNG
jgi:hypothetical protein